MIDIRQSLHYANYLKSQGWIVESLPAGKAGIDNVNYFIRKFPLIGSVLKVQRPERLDLNKVRNLAEKYRVFQTIIEPKDEIQAKLLTSNGFKLSKSPYLPSKTLQIDLTKSEKEIFANFKKDTRRAVNKAAFAKGYGEPKGDSGFIKEYSSPDEIKIWQTAWKNSVNYSRYVPSVEALVKIKKSFPCLAGRQAQSSSLFLASHNIIGRIIGGVLFTTSSHGASNYITYYWYGFTNSEGRSTLSQYSLLYRGILWAKKLGYKVFDFEGIYDERFPNKSWLGFTHFKRSFGGQEVLYPGCYTKFRLPF